MPPSVFIQKRRPSEQAGLAPPDNKDMGADGLVDCGPERYLSGSFSYCVQLTRAQNNISPAPFKNCRGIRNYDVLRGLGAADAPDLAKRSNF